MKVGDKIMRIYRDVMRDLKIGGVYIVLEIQESSIFRSDMTKNYEVKLEGVPNRIFDSLNFVVVNTVEQYECEITKLVTEKLVS